MRRRQRQMCIRDRIGVDRAKMRLYDCEQKAQEDILDNGSEEEYNKYEKVSKKTFAEFKF